MLISESYRELNGLLHRTNDHYGTSGHRYAKVINRLVEELGTRDILDYGCGKRTLETALGFPITNYDPCIPGLDKAPEPHDIVVCTDVLEHIEPDCLDSVLADLRRCTKKTAFLMICIVPAMKTLADGRNAHLIQQPFDWWRASIQQAGFTIAKVHEMKIEFAVVCE